MLRGGGARWQSAKSRLPPYRAVVRLATQPRTLLLAAAALAFFLLGRTFRGSGIEKFYCWGPPKAPVEMSGYEQSLWHSHLQTPVIFNHHKPIEVDGNSINYINLNNVTSTPRAVHNQERILIVTPLRDAAPYLPNYFDLLSLLTYPHNLIDLAFLVGDSTDDTLALLARELERVQRVPKTAFRSTMIVEKDFGAVAGQNVEDRHGFAAQGPRRKLMGKARNYLLSAAMKPDHSWVYWRDVDIKESPASIIEDFVKHDKDVLVPNVWFHRYEEVKGKGKIDIEGRFDYNSWIESEQGLKLASRLPKDVVLAEGYKEYKTHRTYMCRMGDWRLDKDEEIELDGIGGVNIIVKADVHRAGINFPCYAFENQAETEGFAKMAKRAGFGVFGLPNYVVWHIDTEEKPGNA